jgi:hypothetical protein
MKKIEKLIMMNGMEKWEIIKKYNLERKEEKKEMEVGNSGIIKVRVKFVEEILRIEIINDRKMKKMEKSGLCDKYVKVNLLKEEKLKKVKKNRKKKKKKKLFKIFDENFNIKINNEKKDISNGMIMLKIKDKEFMGKNEFLGEAFI